MNQTLRQGGFPTQKPCTFMANWYAAELKEFSHADLVILRGNLRASRKETKNKKHIAMCSAVIVRTEKILVDRILRSDRGSKE